MDAIAAISTGNQIAAIGVLRLSGDGAFAIADGVFVPADGRPLSAHPRRTMVYGALKNREGETIDQALAVTFAAGHSYTGEDSVEFHCHGSPVVLAEGLGALFAAGARQALGGEFTKRAFLSGNMDLTQAEAVIDLIEAETPQAARNAVEQLGGALRRQIDEVYDGLLEITSRFYAVVDYPDEDIEDLQRPELESALRAAEHTLSSLLATARRGQILKNGVPTAIIGRPNAGKSSLLNALVGYDRAIVTDVPGTTRDTVEEKVLCGGVLLRLIDTAGLRETGDAVERLGVERTRATLASAELVLLVIDGSQALTDEDREALRIVREAHKPCIVVFSKADLGIAQPHQVLEGDGGRMISAVHVSSVTGEGITVLEDTVAAVYPAGGGAMGSILTNPRQTEAVERALTAVRGAREALTGGMTPDAVLTDAEAALGALGELSGRTAREDMVERIFSRFCVGK